MTTISSKLKVILAQLPHPSYLDRNVPLAAGYLKASAFAHGLLESADVQILDPETSDYSGCWRLVDAIVARRPDVVGFSLYLWNVVRTLHVVEQIKERLPSVRVVVGGPEVTEDSDNVLACQGIDAFVLGEGEETFAKLLASYMSGTPSLSEIPGLVFRADGALCINGRRKRIEDLESIPSPYLLGYIDPARYRETMLFTMRGCTMGCSYCAWGARGKLRPFSIDRLESELALARSAGRPTIVSIVDSAFNLSPVFTEFCERAREINQDGLIRFSGFVQADVVTERTARLMKECNFTAVEVGLQSTDPQVLRNIGRDVDKTEFLRGVRILQQAGLPVKVDIILGLPGDTRETFEETMRFVAENGLDGLLFNLSVAHGARLRREAHTYGIAAQQAPPFYVLGTRTFSHAELKASLGRHVEASADLDRVTSLYYPALASRAIAELRATGSDVVRDVGEIGHPVRSIILDLCGPHGSEAENRELARHLSHIVASHLSLLCRFDDGGRSCRVDLLEALLTEISTANPYITWDICLETKTPGIVIALTRRIRTLLRRSRGFLDYRDELFPAHLPLVRRTGLNILSLLPWDARLTGLRLGDSKLVRTATVPGDRPGLTRIRDVVRSSGDAFLLDIPGFPSLDFVRPAMEMLQRSGKTVFFRDAVLRRLWEQEYLKITPDTQAHYELLIDRDLTLHGRLFDESDLVWEAVSKWKLVKPEYDEAELSDLILGKVAAAFGAHDSPDALKG